MAKLTREESARVDQYVRDYSARDLAGMLVEVERVLARVRREAATRRRRVRALEAKALSTPTPEARDGG